AAGGGPDMSILGEPKTARDQAFLRMMSRDPEKALKIQSTLRDSFIDRLKGEHDFYGLAVEEMGRVQDDAGWQAALSRLNPYAAVLGVDLGESVPLTYPGPEAVKGLMERALPVKERLDYLMRVANTDADNARADRNTDSIIGTREGRLDEARRNNDARLATTRRGQDLTDARTRRGQDLSAARPRGGKAAAQAGTVSNPRAVKTPTEAAALPKGTYYKTPDGRVKIR
ncbi:hypothetical protein, partial [Sphingobium sp.]|uniref:hypothetical protein n=1 Tax=Sphingobium sp. TaxID=1912891 RepID=UPI002C96575D